MKDLFLSFKGAMTCEDVAKILNVTPDTVRRMSKAGEIPRIPGMRLHRFDPQALVDVLCAPKVIQKTRSLTIERHKTSAKSNGGIRKCL